MYDLDTIQRMNAALAAQPEQTYSLFLLNLPRTQPEKIVTMTARQVSSPRRFARAYREAVPGAVVAHFAQKMAPLGATLVQDPTMTSITWADWSIVKDALPEPGDDFDPDEYLGDPWACPGEHDGRL